MSNKPASLSFRPRRISLSILTIRERSILGILAVALIWGLSGGAVRILRVRSRSAAGPEDLYHQLKAALPDRGFTSHRQEAELEVGADRSRIIYLTRPPFPGQPEVEMTEDGWIFFPRNYYATININQAGLDQLITLPGIGPVTAWRIINYRKCYVGFSRVKALQRVKGIGDNTLKRLEGKIRLY